MINIFNNENTDISIDDDLLYCNLDEPIELVTEAEAKIQESLMYKAPQSTNTDISIVQKLKYCYNNNIPFDTRAGLKNIYNFTELIPYSQKDGKEMKEFYDSVNLKPYGSGEYPVPSTFNNFAFLNEVTYNDNCSAFYINRYKIDFESSVKKEVHEKAVNIYMQKHYKDSPEAEHDELSSYTKSTPTPKIVNNPNVKSVCKIKMEQLISLLDQNIPEGCSLLSEPENILLKFDTFDGYISALKTGLYDIFDNHTIDCDINYSLEEFTYREWNFEDEITGLKQAINQQNEVFSIIDAHTFNDKSLLILKSGLRHRARRLIDNYIIPKISPEEAQKYEVNVEEYFSKYNIPIEKVKLITPRYILKRAYYFDEDTHS